jgi:hypothetical protein
MRGILMNLSVALNIWLYRLCFTWCEFSSFDSFEIDKQQKVRLHFGQNYYQKLVGDKEKTHVSCDLFIGENNQSQNIQPSPSSQFIRE